MKKIPFYLMPASWGLKGKSYEKAKIEYELPAGFEKEMALLKVEFLDFPENYPQKLLLELQILLKYNKISQETYDLRMLDTDPALDPLERKRRLNDVNLKYKLISDYDYKKEVINLSSDTEEQKSLKLLDLDLEFHKVKDQEYEKQKATLTKQPWVSVVNFGIDTANPSQLGEIELDWNDYFVAELKKAGYTGPNDYFIINKWFEMVCSTVALETGLVESTAPKQKSKKGGDDKPLDGDRKEYT